MNDKERVIGTINSKIALSMIVKGTGTEPMKLERALNSIAKFVDGIYITLTGSPESLKDVEEVCKKYNVNISYERVLYEVDKKEITWLEKFFGYTPFSKVGDKIFQFDKARNFNLDLIPKDYDWILWMDCDDVFRGGENLHQVIDQAFAKGDEAIYMNYIYQADLDEKLNIKHVIIEHLRERIVRNNGAYKWIAPIHETLIEQRPTQKSDNYNCDILHVPTDLERLQSLERNLKNLELSIYLTEGKDPRPLYYLAKALYDRSNKEDDMRAIKLIELYLWGENKSGWPEERAQSAEYASEIWRRNGDNPKSLQAAFTALYEQPENPSIYLNIAVTYMVMQLWERSLFWVRLASMIPDPKGTLIRNPKDLQGRTLEVIFNASLNLHKVDEAWAASVKIKELFPNEKFAQDAFMMANNLKLERDLTKEITHLASYLKQSGESPKIKALLNSIPEPMKTNPFMINLYQQNNPPTVWGKKDIVIYCGPGFTQWSPKQLDNPEESFVGGSEEAVVLMGKTLQNQGWNVTVYNDPGNDEGLHDGVNYLPYYKFNRYDLFNILIGWRDIRFFDTDFRAKKKFLWCHDVQNSVEYTPERVARIDKVFFLSKWHRDNVPNLEEGKVFLTTNGI